MDQLFLPDSLSHQLHHIHQWNSRGPSYTNINHSIKEWLIHFHKGDKVPPKTTSIGNGAGSRVVGKRKNIGMKQINKHFMEREILPWRERERLDFIHVGEGRRTNCYAIRPRLEKAGESSPMVIEPRGSCMLTQRGLGYDFTIEIILQVRVRRFLVTIFELAHVNDKLSYFVSTCVDVSWVYTDNREDQVMGQLVMPTGGILGRIFEIWSSLTWKRHTRLCFIVLRLAKIRASVLGDFL
ncbi:hypothetical protein Syun_022843 [Stephania yunnanensis]|uniref:Uncharacterized protein n=1 Tax=Stephania yunnanensis TaxID=152371 RepID=A0AAP0FFP8_9MAGN